MFERQYQGGSSVEILSASGRDPLDKWKVSSKKQVRKIFEKGVRGFVFECGGSTSAKMNLPRSERETLGLVQPFMVIQLYLEATPLKPFSLGVSMRDNSKSKRRVILSTNFKDISITPLHVQLPLGLIKRGVWVNFVLDLKSIMEAAFKSRFHSLDSVEIRSYCKVRRVFTMKAPLADDTDDAELLGWNSEYEHTAVISRSHNYPIGVPYRSQIYNMSKARNFADLQRRVSRISSAGSRIPASLPSRRQLRRQRSLASIDKLRDGESKEKLTQRTGRLRPRRTESNNSLYSPKGRRSPIKRLSPSSARIRDCALESSSANLPAFTKHAFPSRRQTKNRKPRSLQPLKIKDDSKPKESKDSYEGVCGRIDHYPHCRSPEHTQRQVDTSRKLPITIRVEREGDSKCSATSRNKVEKQQRREQTRKSNSSIKGGSNSKGELTDRPFSPSIGFENLELESARPPEKQDSDFEDTTFRQGEELKVRDFSGTYNEDKISEGNDSADWEVTSTGKPEEQGAEERANVQEKRDWKENVGGNLERHAKETEEELEVERFAHFGLEEDKGLDHVINDSRPPTSCNNGFLEIRQERLMTPPLQLDQFESDNYGPTSAQSIPGVLDGRLSPKLRTRLNAELDGSAMPSNEGDSKGTLIPQQESRESVVKLMYDPVLECYYDPASNKYFHFDTS
mmetsp:Transcript_8258/g.16119  ORF Transcript_8258/g.16119 Transcript_8258/m.16119 type:complete len:681 (+) Transcript_8258:58-2100(+)